ncbi:hypothetical protein Hdeb2414_s0007g00247151 [Helianthus debilis subsp. tardiflorus]
MNRINHWNSILDTFDKRLSIWKASTLSIRGLALLKSVMETLPTYFFSLFKAPCKIIDQLKAKRRQFFRGGNEDKHKMSWVSWKVITSPIKEGGLGLTSLKEANIALLSKWWWGFKNEPNAFMGVGYYSFTHDEKLLVFHTLQENFAGYVERYSSYRCYLGEL